MQTLLKGPVFIITDDLATSEAVESLFQSIRVKSVSFASATQAVTAYKTSVKAHPPQVILIDVELKGDRDGFHISEELTELDSNDDTIRVLLTDQQIPFTKLLTATSGAVAVLRKNQYTGLGLIEELEALLRRKAERFTDRTRVLKAPGSSGDGYLKAVVLFILLGLAAWSINNRIADARWQGQVEGTLKSDQQHTQQLLKIMKDDVDMSWAYALILRDTMKDSGLKPPPIPKRPNYSEDLEK